MMYIQFRDVSPNASVAGSSLCTGSFFVSTRFLQQIAHLVTGYTVLPALHRRHPAFHSDIRRLSRIAEPDLVLDRRIETVDAQSVKVTRRSGAGFL